MTLTDICQGKCKTVKESEASPPPSSPNHLPRRLPLLCRLALLLLGCPAWAGCLHLRAEPRLAVAVSLPASGLPAQESGWAWVGVVALLVGLGGVGWLWWRRHRREVGESWGWDREDLALLRTARDALALLVRRHLVRAAAESLRRLRRVAGGGGSG